MYVLILGDAIFTAMDPAIETFPSHQQNPGTESTLMLVGNYLSL